MKNMKKIADTIKKFNFFDPFPATDYFALVVHKSNSERLYDAVVEVNEESKRTLLQLSSEIKESIGRDDIGDTETLLRIYLTKANDFKVHDSEWNEIIGAKCERHGYRRGSEHRSLDRRRSREDELQLGILQRFAQRAGG